MALDEGAPVQTVRAQAKQDKQDRLGLNRDITKAVLASPLTIPWPNLPKHLQAAVLQRLPELVPDPIAEYHVSRARCHTKDKRAARRQNRSKKESAVEVAVVGSEGALQPLVPPTSTSAATSQVEKVENRPVRPDILDHLVLGINETIKALEEGISELKLRLLLMADRINGVTTTISPAYARSSATRANLLPTAHPQPDEADTANSPAPAPLPLARREEAEEFSPLVFVVIPLLSISPQSLVLPILQYAATYNGLVWQWNQLVKGVQSRVKEVDRATAIGPPREEVRVVPLGRVELKMAAMVGLRRLAALGIRASHPHLSTLTNLLPKSILHSPRHALTLPFATSQLKVHTGKISAKPKVPAREEVESGRKKKEEPLLPHITYAPLHVKGINTTLPADGNARKRKRLEEVRQRRVEVKAKKRAERGQREVVPQEKKKAAGV